jgi:hypothetical protein
LQKIYANFGVDALDLSIPEIYEAIWNDGQVVAVGRWMLRRSYWKGNDYLEVLDVSGRERVDYLKSLGCLTEMVKFTIRAYIPTNGRMMTVLESLKSL